MKPQEEGRPHVFSEPLDRLVGDGARIFFGIGACDLSHCVVEELEAAASKVGFPCVLKRAHAGYDGKGQRIISEASQLAEAWDSIAGGPAIVEEFVRFDCEVSVLLARNPTGEVRFYPLAHNTHRNHVLRTTVAPAAVGAEVAQEGFELAATIANALDHIGMMAVEMYLVGGKTLLVNEIAPRVHNSGHWTIDGAECSQFENHVRAVAGLPLGATDMHGHALMFNWIGEMPDSYGRTAMCLHS